MSELPRFGIVVPSFNQGRFLDEALASLFAQEYPALEVVVMDGGSTDETLDVIRRWEPRLAHWQSGADAGQAAAINEGMKRCRGELVGWLNSDDRHLGDALWTVARACAANPGFGLYVGNGLRERDGRRTPFCRRHLALDRRALALGLDYVLQPATFIRRDAWEAVGGLRSHLHYCLDWDVVLRVAAGHPAVLINEFLAVSREHDQTKTTRGRLERVAEIFKMAQEHTGRGATAGALVYLVEALRDLTDDGLLPPLRRPLALSRQSLSEELARLCGNADGFPERGDPQDAVHLPLAGRPGPRRPVSETTLAGLPTISVVVPSFNQARYLPRTLESLLAQDYPRLETLVFDGGSTDGSVDLLRGYEGRLTRWASETDRGPAHALNKGLAVATGEVVGWLNSDDMLAEGALFEIGRAFAEDPALDLVFANGLYVDEDDRPYPADHGAHRTALYYGEAQPAERVHAYWRYVHAIPQPTVYFRKRLLAEHGALDESFHYIFDFELFFRLMSKARVRKLERTLAFYRIHAAGKTSDWERFLVELYRFSRPRWPGVWSRAFWETWWDFLRQFPRRRFGRGPRDRRVWPVLALVALSTLTRIGNPESLSALAPLRKVRFPRVLRVRH